MSTHHNLKLYTMIKDQLINQLRSRSEIVYTNGEILDYKLYGDRKKRHYTVHPAYESDALNPRQVFLYKRALKGFDVYTKKEIRAMSKDDRRKIVKLYKRTERELTLWKHKLTIAASNEILALLPKSRLAKSLLDYDCLDVNSENSFSFKELGINKNDIIKQLHTVGILPNNFYDINAYENKTKGL
jgi:hypothetical protein